jgi:hypothetical protein
MFLYLKIFFYWFIAISIFLFTFYYEYYYQIIKYLFIEVEPLAPDFFENAMKTGEAGMVFGDGHHNFNPFKLLGFKLIRFPSLI